MNTVQENVSFNGVLKLSNIVTKKIDSGKNLDSISSTKTLIDTAKFYATQEIDQFSKKTTEYINFLDNSALFKDLSQIIESLLCQQMLNDIIKPALAGNRIAGMSQEQFNCLRCDIYKALIDKYNIKNNKN